MLVCIAFRFWQSTGYIMERRNMYKYDHTIAILEGRKEHFKSINKMKRESAIRREIRDLESEIRLHKHDTQALRKLKEAQKRLKIIQIDADEFEAEESVIRKIKNLKIKICGHENFLENNKGVLAKIRYSKEIKENQRLLEQLKKELEEAKKNLEKMKRNFDERRRVEIEEIEKNFNETHREKVEVMKEMFGEDYSYEELVERVFYINGNIMQIDPKNCYSKEDLNRIFDLKNIELKFRRDRNINLYLSDYETMRITWSYA